MRLMKLPETFLENMKELLGGEYSAWLASYEENPHQGLRINTGKLTAETWKSISPYGTEQVLWTGNGYYIGDQDRPARDPYYYAGLYYLQEPSAMAPAALLPVDPGDRVLDLCAAPGGKSTELGARLKGQGLLVSNDISNSRAKALLKNLELAGVSNLCVTSETPEKLADVFGPFFDKILVDAPCSGEGMFRKDPDLIKSWQEHGPSYYAPIQRQILSQAVRMLKPGGYLLYSTCTFAACEDEDTVHWLLDQESELELMPLLLWEGAQPGINKEPVIRLFPHKIKGEGHFAALFHKKSSSSSQKISEEQATGKTRRKGQTGALRKGPSDAELGEGFLQWEQQLSSSFPRERMMIRDQLVYLLPEDFEPGWRLRYLRTGLLLGEQKKQRFEPSQAAAMVLSPSRYACCFSMKRSDERVIRYLKGETVSLTEEEAGQDAWPKNGWILVCVDGWPLGWAKNAGAVLKNKYYPGWRWQ